MRFSFCFLATILCTLATGIGFAQDSEEKLEYPLQVIHASSVNRLQEKSDAMFAAAGRPEVNDVVNNWLQTAMKELPGWDRAKPFGMMIYLKPGLQPGIAGISYIPTTDAKATLNWLAGAKGIVTEVSGKPGQYDIVDVEWGPDLTVKHSGDYLFLTAQSDAAELGRRFPAPERMVAKLNARYDVAYSLLLKNLPPATKTLFISFFKTSALAGLQQRDDEPEAAYRIRRANGEALIDMLDRFVNQAEEFTVGGTIDPETKTGVVEVELNGTKDSKLAKYFQDMEGRRSLFAPLLSNPATFTMNASWQLDPKQRKVFTEMFTLGPELIETQAQKDGQATSTAVMQPIFKTFLSTAENGHFDFFVQLAGEEAFDYALSGGIRLQTNRDFPDQFRALMEYIKGLKVPEVAQAEPAPAPAPGEKAQPANQPGGRAAPPNTKEFQPRRANRPPRPTAQEFSQTASKVLEGMKIGDSQLGEYAVHAIPLPTPRDSMGKVMFGDAPTLYLYATPNALWFSLGGDSARDKLSAQVDAVAEAATSGAPRPASTTFLLISHAQQWLTAALSTGETDPDDEEFQPFTNSFTADNDEVRITSKATDTGVRGRAEFQSGYVGLLGRLIIQSNNLDGN